MKYINIVLWMIGAGLLVLLCLLLSEQFSDLFVLYLDGCVLLGVYTLWLYIYGGLFAKREVFAHDVPAVGFRLHAFWLYAVLSVTGIAIGIAYAVSFIWQVFYQICFLFPMLFGLLMGSLSAGRLDSVAEQSAQCQQPKELLLDLARQLQVKVSGNTAFTPAFQQDISRLVERIAYISPSTSSQAVELERQLQISIRRLQQQCNSGLPAERLSEELERTNELLSQRIKTY